MSASEQEVTDLKTANMVLQNLVGTLAVKLNLSKQALKRAEVYAGPIATTDKRFNLLSAETDNDAHAAETALNEISDVLRMSKAEIDALRSQPEPPFPEQTVQQVVDFAVNQINTIIASHGEG